EGLTKVYGAAILISGETLSRLSTPEKYAHRFLGKVKVKGKKIAVAVFEIYQGDPCSLKQFKTQTRTKFETAVELFEQEEFAQAQRLFENLLQQDERDNVLQLYLERVQKAQIYGTKCSPD
ncbi:MAG: hypothetical protein WA919_16585, partial [Coleofasciculaceae cyanobacterium]